MERKDAQHNIASDISFLENGVPFCKTGFGVLQNTYSGGRTGASVNQFGGLSQIVYFGPTPEEAPATFFKGDPSTSYMRCFRAQIVVGDDPYNLEFSDTVHFPFGYKSRFVIAEREVEVEHSLSLINDSLVFTLRVLRNAQKLPLRHRFEHHHSARFGPPGGVARTFSNWQDTITPGGWAMTVHDNVTEKRWRASRQEMRAQQKAFSQNLGRYPRLDPGIREATTVTGFFGDSPLSMRMSHSGRIYFTSQPFTGGTHACALLFAPGEEAFTLRAKAIRKELPAIAGKCEKDFLKRLKTQPGIDAGDPVFESLLAHSAPTLESLMPEDVPGTIRSNALYYWFWGWDVMMAAETCALTGLEEFLPDALKVYRDSAHPKQGVGHMFTRLGKIKRAQAYSAQTIYPIMLWREGVHGGSLETLKEYYPFARTLFQRILGTVNGAGLGIGESNTPDYPKCAGHTGNDISVFNNSILYQGARCMEEMAGMMNDHATADICRDLSRRMEKSFAATFWDEEAGYFADSVDSETGEKRRSYPSYALFWLTPFAGDLIGEKIVSCGKFIAKNHKSPRGFLMYPRWDRSFDGDGSQMAQVWSTYDVFLTRCLAAAGQEETLAHWMAGCDWFWKQLTWIEGYSAQTVNDSGTPDCPGIKQLFALSVYYRAFLGGCAGLQFDRGGLTLEEGMSRSIRISRLPLRDKQLDLELKGSGKFPKKLIVNGQPVKGSRKIPLRLLRKKNHIVHERTETPPKHPVILSFCAGELISVNLESRSLRAEVAGWADAWLHYHSPFQPRVICDGGELPAQYDPASREGKVLLPLRNGTKHFLEIVRS